MIIYIDLVKVIIGEYDNIYNEFLAIDTYKKLCKKESLENDCNFNENYNFQIELRPYIKDFFIRMKKKYKKLQIVLIGNFYIMNIRNIIKKVLEKNLKINFSFMNDFNPNKKQKFVYITSDINNKKIYDNVIICPEYLYEKYYDLYNKLLYHYKIPLNYLKNKELSNYYNHYDDELYNSLYKSYIERKNYLEYKESLKDNFFESLDISEYK